MTLYTESLSLSLYFTLALSLHLWLSLSLWYISAWRKSHLRGKNSMRPAYFIVFSPSYVCVPGPTDTPAVGQKCQCLERKTASLLVSHGLSGMMADGEERGKSKDFSHRLIKHKFMYSRKHRLKMKMVLFFIIGARTHVHGCWHNYRKKEDIQGDLRRKRLVIFWEFVGLLDMGTESDEVTSLQIAWT